MGIYLHIEISKSVTKEEWVPVYEETLKLVEAFPFGEKRKVDCNGISTICMVPTRERVLDCGWMEGIGWHTIGDYESMNTAENYYLNRDMIKDGNVDPEAGDAIMDCAFDYIDEEEMKNRKYTSYSLWGNKTQGEPYHMYLLAVACLIEDRLGDKAFVYGDITRGQCNKAVEMANKILEKPIKVPSRCDAKRFLDRVSKLPMSPIQQLKVFEHYYLGIKDEEFGEFLRATFAEEVFDDYWKKFQNYDVGMLGFDDYVSEYLMWGFDLDKLSSFVDFEKGLKEDEPKDAHYKEFVKRIMDAKLHLKEKNCEDAVSIDQEEESPYGIGSLMAQFFFAGAKNKKVDRYIPIEDIRSALKNSIGHKIDVDAIIDEYLAKEAKETEIVIAEDMSEESMMQAIEQDPAEVFNQEMELLKENLSKKKQYDVNDLEDLIYYEAGDEIHPGVIESITSSFKFCQSLVSQEEWYGELMEQSPRRRCEWLVERNQYFLLQEKDWVKIFTDIEENKDSFARYYPMMRVEYNSRSLIELMKAFVLNDELYDYVKKLARD